MLLFKCNFKLALDYLCVDGWQSNTKKETSVDTSCVKQSDKHKYAAHVLGGAVSKKYRHYYCDTPKYAVHVLGGAVSKTYICFPTSRNYRH